MGAPGATKPKQRSKHYNQTQGINIDHRESAIRRRSVTEGCEDGESRKAECSSRVQAKWVHGSCN